MIDEIHDEISRKADATSLSLSTHSVSGPENEDQLSKTVDSGASSIEKSKAVKSEVIPPINSPILSAPTGQESMAFAVASIDAFGKPVLETVHSFILQGEEIKHSVLQNWMKNLKEIEEVVRQLLSSPLYRQLQDIRSTGDPQSSHVSGIQGITSANVAGKKGGQIELLSTLDRLKVLERVPTSQEVSGDSPPPKDSSQLLILPLSAALLAGVGLAGSSVIHTTQSTSGIVEMIGRLQPLFPAVSLQDIVPLINLMVVGPIYFNSWREAVNNLTKKEQQTHVSVIHSFAKDVIKIVTDPHFVNQSLIEKLKGSDKLTPEGQEKLAQYLKIVLIGVALSLVYSVEVGKIQKGKYGGIEPGELRDLLLGKGIELNSSQTKLSLQEELKVSLVHRAWEQLQLLSANERIIAVEMLLNHVSEGRALDAMLDPAKIFEETLSSRNIKHFV